MPPKPPLSFGSSSAFSWPQRYGVQAGLALALTVVLAWIGVWQLQLRLELAMAVSMAAMLACAILLGLQQYALQARSASRTPTGPKAGLPMHAMPAGEQRWSLDLLDAMDPRHFAKLCETWFSWAGFDTRTETSRGGGVDIWLHARRVSGPVAIVRCRHLRNQPVGLRDMQDFFGVISAHQTAHGTYTTTSTYTPEALQFAQECGIDAVDGRGLLRRIQTRTRHSQQALLAVALQAST